MPEMQHLHWILWFFLGLYYARQTHVYFAESICILYDLLIHGEKVLNRFDENGEKFFKRVENIVGKGETAHYKKTFTADKLGPVGKGLSLNFFYSFRW